MKGGTKINIVDFEGFKVYNNEDKFGFLYADFNDEDRFLEGLISYIFKEENLLYYTEINTGIKFELGKKEKVRLYKNINLFLNQEISKIPINNLDLEIEKILNEDYGLFKDDSGENLIGNDKMGRIGEYIFHLLLSKYFKYICIIPKFKHTTNRNMSVFGIDALFYDQERKEILFGESKFSKEISSGITLINHSLGKYEESIKEEFLLVFSNDDIKFNDIFFKNFNDKIGICTTFQEFIKESNITKIIIPIFIAHGGDYKNYNEKFLNILNKINKKDFFGLETKYLFISLPVIDKDKFTNLAILTLRGKSEIYE